MPDEQRRGMFYALACYGVWGLVPLYWHAMNGVSAIDILANRMVWSLLFVLLLLVLRRQWSWIGPAVHSRRTVLTYTGAALLLAANWYIYIWAVNSDYVVESSLGYFITPLVNVLFGVVIFHERLRLGQWASIGLAAAGVLFLTLAYGHLPWIGLSLAFTFGCYGLLKKQARLPALDGMAMETAILFLPALAFLIYRQRSGAGPFGQVPVSTELLLMSTGVVTVIPLLWFSAAARRIPLSMLGFFQYLAPTLQFLLGILVFHEPFDQAKLIGFAIIWAALALYSTEGIINRQRVAARAPQTSLSTR